MKTTMFVASMFILSCSPGSLPERDDIDGAAPTSRDPAMPDSGEVTKADLRSPRTVEECRACNGEWGMHGLADAISQTESCDCRTNDAGKRCTDGSDCQGMCVADADNPEYVVIDIGPPARGFLVGRCSELVTVFGCNALVDPGARDEGPISTDEPPPVVCVD